MLLLNHGSAPSHRRECPVFDKADDRLRTHFVQQFANFMGSRASSMMRHCSKIVLFTFERTHGEYTSIRPTTSSFHPVKSSFGKFSSGPDPAVAANRLIRSFAGGIQDFHSCSKLNIEENFDTICERWLSISGLR